MTSLLVSSKMDIASMNIKGQLLTLYPFKQSADDSYQGNPVYKLKVNGKELTLITLNQETVKAQQLPEDFPDLELAVFITRHSSQSGKPTLTTHTPGNFTAAEFGGLPKCLSIAPAHAMQEALKKLYECKMQLGLGDFAVSYEATHHGPSISVPCMFVELGSSEVQWRNELGAKAVATAAVSAFNATQSLPVVLGIGGTHYNSKFTELALADKAVFGHMIPKYAVSQIDSEMLLQCVNKTRGKVSHAILDWKGIQSQDKPSLIKALEEANLTYIKI